VAEDIEEGAYGREVCSSWLTVEIGDLKGIEANKDKKFKT